MDGYTFDEGVAFLVLVKAPLGVINHLKATHNRSNLHSEIHKQLRIPSVKEIVRRNMGNSPQNSSNFPIANEPKSPNGEDGSEELPESDNKLPESDNKLPNSEQNFQNSHENGEKSDSDDTEIILTKHDVRTHENTRLEDMPNKLCRTLWLKRQDVYREAQQAHLKMRNVPEGEAHNEERAKWRAEILRLIEVVNDYWKQIDEEIARFNSQVPEPVEGPAKETPAFNVSTYRAYISKALRKKSLTPAQLTELQHRVDAMIQAGVEIEGETLEKLKAIGVSTK